MSRERVEASKDAFAKMSHHVFNAELMTAGGCSRTELGQALWVTKQIYSRVGICLRIMLAHPPINAVREISKLRPMGRKLGREQRQTSHETIENRQPYRTGEKKYIRHFENERLFPTNSRAEIANKTMACGGEFHVFAKRTVPEHEQ